MTRKELLELLTNFAAMEGNGDIEANHSRADDALLMFINDPEITAAYQAIHKWYA